VKHWNKRVYETKIAVVYKHRSNLTAVGGNKYKQCNFENISACKRNYKKKSSGYRAYSIDYPVWA